MNMNDLSLNFEEISRKFPKLSDLNFDYGSIINNIDIQPTKVKIDEKSTFAYQMQQQTNQIIKKSDEQISLLKQQNEQLVSNYEKLEGLYVLKEQELSDAKQEALKAKEEAKKLRREKVFSYIFNFVTLVIAVLAWLYPRG